MREPLELRVHLAHDEEAAVWYVASSDIPGLFLEADTPEALISRISAAAPEMIALNQAEILKNHEMTRETTAPRLLWRPVFDSSMALAHA